MVFAWFSHGLSPLPTDPPGASPRRAAAAEDFDAAAELLRSAGRRPEAEIEAERAAVQRMAAEDEGRRGWRWERN